ncbi:putative flagella-related protein [Pyrococcus sp. NA2]|uniref:flagellar protein n=1 Tax=Pyrococcus sp. (strain NA2) TaxID=342949 RepID=UPI000209ABDC|nr:flagellar protein [Pyrococcus sp. NA2]AEC52096.1 putative flagella-related protein [Pyrococcus sp. NA2]
MGFSVSASAAIIFISFLVSLGTIYIVWENSYSEVQAAREFWYSLRNSQLHFNVGNVTVSPYNTTHVYVNFTYLGQTLDGKIDVLHNGIYVSSVDVSYLIPGESYSIIVPGADTSGSLNHLTLAFDNGCITLVAYYYNGAAYTINSVSIQCPLEVS